MSLRSLLVVALSIVFGGSAAIGVNSLRNQAPAAPVPETAPVVVAAADIPRGTQISSGLLTTRDWPKGLVPPGALTNMAEAQDRVALTAMVKEDTLLDSKLAPKGAGRGLTALVPDGMRAFTIQTPNVASGVAGFILPGNRVDVLLTVNGGGSNDATGGGSTTTLLQNVEILAVDQRMEAPSENKVDPAQLRSVTLLVTPDQCGMLSLAQNKGTLQLSLRSLRDSRAAATRPVTLADLRLYEEKPLEEKAEPLRPVVIRTLRGNQEGAIRVMPARGPRTGGR